MQGVSGMESSMSNALLWKKTIELNRLINEQRPGVVDQANKIAKLETEIRTGKVQCQTCASRKYVDRSNDPSVSFKTPASISPSQSKAAVLSHEMEHVKNENAKATSENREVIQSSVSIEYAVCPECGATYVAGGETRTTTRTVQNTQAQNTENMVQNNKDDGAGNRNDGKRLNLLA